MRRDCAKCGVAFDAKRATAKFCSPRCRVAASRSPGSVNALVGGGTRGTVLTALVEVGRDGTYLGGIALTLADRIDSTPGSGAAALARELRVTMGEALKGASTGVSRLDDLKARRDAKRAIAG